MILKPPLLASPYDAVRFIADRKRVRIKFVDQMKRSANLNLVNYGEPFTPKGKGGLS